MFHLSFGRLKSLKNNIVSLNHLTPTSKESISNIQTNKNSIISNVAKEVKVFDEKDHTLKTKQNIVNHWQNLKERLLKLDDLELGYTIYYIKVVLDSKILVYNNFRKDHIRIDIIGGSISPDGKKSKNYFYLDDPKKLAKVNNKKWTDKNLGSMSRDIYEITFNEKTDLDYLMFLIKQKYSDL